MATTFWLRDSEAVSDLKVFLERAIRVDPASTRFVSDGGILQVSAPVLIQRGILDRTPTILGMRIFDELSNATFDRTVQPSSVTERLSRPRQLSDTGSVIVSLPTSDAAASWVGISAPRDGWISAGAAMSSDMRSHAAAGITAVRDALPDSAGEAVVQQVREFVWGAAIDQHVPVPRGAAFALETLGFISQVDEEPIQIFTHTLGWIRLTTARGHVLVKGSGTRDVG